MTNHLKHFAVAGLFGLYDHSITFNMDRRITAIIGPNGRGKTVCLKLIEALFSRRYEYFVEFPYGLIQFTFLNGEVISIVPRIMLPDAGDDETHETPIIEIEFSDSNGKKENWEPSILKNDDYIVRRLSRYVPFLTRMGPNRWVDDRDGELLTSSEVVRRHRNELPSRLQRHFEDDEPTAFSELIEAIDCQLIETQRLLVLGQDDQFIRWHHTTHRPVPRSMVSELAVRSKAEHLKEIIESTLAQYATLSQSLDRTFPRRVLEHLGSDHLDEISLRAQLEELDEKRSKLMSAGVLDKEMEPVSIAAEKIEAEVAKVLEIYVADTNEKLKVFDLLLAKLSTLTELISQRFIDKTLEIDRAEGFKVSYAGDREIPLEKLSSGEQHQLILVYDLLFEVKNNSLILIDEPELSLHVSWQKKFIEGLEKMIALNGFDVVIATHSPPLVAEHFDLTVELGDVEEPK